MVKVAVGVAAGVGLGVGLLLGMGLRIRRVPNHRNTISPEYHITMTPAYYFILWLHALTLPAHSSVHSSLFALLKRAANAGLRCGKKRSHTVPVESLDTRQVPSHLRPRSCHVSAGVII